jgi:hypothetical protein
MIQPRIEPNEDTSAFSTTLIGLHQLITFDAVTHDPHLAKMWSEFAWPILPPSSNSLIWGCLSQLAPIIMNQSISQPIILGANHNENQHSQRWDVIQLAEIPITLVIST